MLQNTNKKDFNQGFVADDQVKFQVLQFKDHRVFHTLGSAHVTFWLHLPPVQWADNLKKAPTATIRMSRLEWIYSKWGTDSGWRSELQIYNF